MKRWSVVIPFTLLVVLSAASGYGESVRSGNTKADVVKEEYPVSHQIDREDDVLFRPIGYFLTPYNKQTGAPRQGILKPEVKATIQIDSIYRKGLADLEKFEYIIALYYFNGVKKWSPTVTPPKSKQKFGLFSTRSPKRPNPIGFSVIRLDSIDMEKGLLQVSGIDAFDGTPVLDIKPYIPSVDIVRSEKNREVEDKLGLHD